MKTLSYIEPGKIDVLEKDIPKLSADTDAIVRLVKTTICGTDLHIIAGHTPEVPEGLTLGHEGVGVIEQIGDSVNNFKVGDKVIISCITACGHCDYCKRQMYSHCADGGWNLGHLIDGTQAEYVRIHHADNSLYHIPKNITDEGAVMLSDILPTGFEIGVLDGHVQPGQTIALVGAGPVGLSALLTAQFFSPATIIVMDLDDNRLQVAKEFGATHVINSANKEDAIKQIMEITNNVGVDVAMEAVGYPTTFDLCQQIIAPGGHISNLGVHGEPVTFELNKLWIKNISLSTGLVNTSSTPMLLKTVNAGKLDPNELITHHFNFNQILEAYDVFKHADDNKALKLIISFDEV